MGELKYLDEEVHDVVVNAMAFVNGEDMIGFSLEIW